ncbi:MAG: hypothetical protein NC548_05920 [Lachnospiraceae bacterium]|nr:hypothetical protein [Lachnospiraceae bacterium]
MSTETKVQIGLVGTCAVLTGLIIHENRKIKQEMAKLLSSTDVFVETASRIAEVVELGNDCIEAGNAQLDSSNKMLDEMLKKMNGGKS